MNADVFTLFPQWFEWFRTQRHVENALALGHTVETVDFRASTPLKWGQVDDTPFGGGAGMVLRVDVMEAALRVATASIRWSCARRRVIALTPAGRLLDDALAGELAAEPELTLLCGRYEGFDERILEHFVTEQVSIGRYVLAGRGAGRDGRAGRGAAQAPGRAGGRLSAVEESFSEALEGAPEYPHYTRPADWRGWTVPDVLLSGHHARVNEWRREQSRRRARVRYHDRPPARPIFASPYLAMSTVIDSLERTQLRRVPRFQAGDRVKVHFQVIEGTRRRTQVFEGVVIKRQGEGVRETFTVRKQSFGVGVERTFPLHSPKIEKIEVAARGDVRRAKLYYLRGRVGKRARVRERRYTGPEEIVERGLLYDPAAEAAAEADAEVPGEAVDEQALAEAEAAETQASADAEAAAAGDEQAG